MKYNKLNILIVASWYPSINEPFNGSFIEEQAIMLMNNGHNVTVLHPYLKGTFINSLSHRKTFTDNSIINNIKVIHIGVSPFLPGFRGLSYFKCYNQTLKIINSLKVEKFDVIHSHSLFLGGYVARNLSRKFNIPHFHTEHTSSLIFQPDIYNLTDKRIIKNVLKSAHRVFFVSEFAKINTLNKWALNCSDKYHVIPNMVENYFFQLTPNSLDKIPFRYILIGSLIPIKGVSTLIDAWKILIQKFPDSLLTIAGEGFLKNELEIQIKNLKLNDSIKLIPRLSRDQVKKQLTNHHVLVSASKLETFGLTVAEAQASGKPVIVTNSGGINDIVNELTGIITGHKPTELAQGLIDIQTNYHKYDQKKISKFTQQKFSPDAVYKKLEEFYYKN
jgi:glycosyltransferase involved in cell wall biosynthesis